MTACRTCGGDGLAAAPLLRPLTLEGHGLGRGERGSASLTHLRFWPQFVLENVTAALRMWQVDAAPARGPADVRPGRLRGGRGVRARHRRDDGPPAPLGAVPANGLRERGAGGVLAGERRWRPRRDAGAVPLPPRWRSGRAPLTGRRGSGLGRRSRVPRCRGPALRSFDASSSQRSSKPLDSGCNLRSIDCTID